MPDKPDYNTKQTVSLKIVAQLKNMTEDEQRQFIGKLLEHMESQFVVALEFAYGLAPEPEQEQEEKTAQEQEP